MNEKKRFKDLLIVQLVMTNIILFTFSFIFFISSMSIIAYLEDYEIHAPRALFSPILTILIILFISIFIGGYLSTKFSKKFLKPIKSLQNGMNEVKNGNLNVKIEEVYNNETKTLISNFNLMVEELRKSEILKSDFITNVSHEFKTPLSSIQGYATLLQDENLSKEYKEKYTNYIIDSTQNLNELVSNILKISKIDNQKIVIEPTIFYLDEQIRESILNLEKEWNMKNIELDIELAEIEIKTDKALLINVWNNLIGNAIKYSMANSKIEIKSYKKEENIVVIIKDYGKGIKEENIPYIFNKFYQEESSHGGEGNGLGLALVKGILDLIGGKIEVKSRINEGSEFIVSLKSNLNNQLTKKKK